MSNINTFNSNNFSVLFSNIPIAATQTKLPSIRLFNNFIKTVSMPDYNLDLIDSSFGNIIRKQPMSRINNDLTQITIDFKVDEDAINYFALWDWINEIRNGRATKNSQSKLHRSNIAAIQVVIKDNEKRERYRIKFKECFLVSLSSLVLQYGMDDEVTFSATFFYDNFEIIRKNNNVKN